MSTLPDTGKRTVFKTGAQRDTMEGKGVPSHIPPEAIRRMALRFEVGLRKYGPRNWQKGIPLSRFQDAITRHTMQAAEGNTDEDHLGAVLWNAAAWVWTYDQILNGALPATLNDLPFHPGCVSVGIGDDAGTGKDPGPERSSEQREPEGSDCMCPPVEQSPGQGVPRLESEEPDWHNPDNLDARAIQASAGYRLLLKSELPTFLAENAAIGCQQYNRRLHFWTGGIWRELDVQMTWRTTLPLP